MKSITTPDLKNQIVGFLTFSSEPVEMLSILEQLRKHNQVDDLIFEKAVAELLQYGFISHVPDTVKLFAGQKEHKVC